MQSRLIGRASVSLISIGIIILFMTVSLGRLFPTTIIMAQVKPDNANAIRIAVFDTQRNSSFRLDLPTSLKNTGTFSDDGRWLILPTENFQFMVWNMLTGQIITFPENYSDCVVLDGWDWIDNDQKVLFQCRHHDGIFMMGGVHVVDIADGTFYPVYYRQNDQISSLVVSPDEKSFLVFDNGWHRVDIDNLATQAIISNERYFFLILWFPDNQALLGLTSTTIEYYHFDALKWDILFENKNYQQVQISPDGNHIALLSDDNPPQVEIFHLASQTRTAIQSEDYSLANAVFIAWSPDSQFLYIRVAPYNSKESNRYYLVRPDNGFITPLAENLTINPIWSPDKRLVSYYTFSPTNTSPPRLYVMDVAHYLADGGRPEPIITYATGVQWSQNNADIAFIYYHPDMKNRAIGFYSLDGNMRFLTGENENAISFTFLR
mgnify:CR=1 FL=1